MMENKPCICLSCKWEDARNAQCYDGHLQYEHRQKCESYSKSEVNEWAKFYVQERKKI